MQQPTMRIKAPDGGFVTINANDFDASTMEKYEEAPQATPQPPSGTPFMSPTHQVEAQRTAGIPGTPVKEGEEAGKEPEKPDASQRRRGS